MTTLLETASAWFPTDYLDEINPADRPNPDAWIVKNSEGFFLDRAAEDYPAALTPLKDGQVVSFSSRTDYGDATLLVKQDFSFEIDQPMPKGADQCCALNGWQSETLSASIEDLVAALRESGINIGQDGDEFVIAYYTFSDPTKFVFHDGAFHLIEEATVH